MKDIGYADPPYLGCGSLYAAHHPDALSWDDPETHRRLIERLCDEFDGWVLHTHVPGLRAFERKGWLPDDVRICGWFKSFAAFKRNVSVAYAWEPVIVRAARKPAVSKRMVYRDFKEVPDSIKCPITLGKGLAGAKPAPVVLWGIELMGSDYADKWADLYPGTGACTAAWESWRTIFKASEIASGPQVPEEIAA